MENAFAFFSSLLLSPDTFENGFFTNNMAASSMTKTHFILYVKDQARSAEFYARVLDRQPSVNVPGMTEFALSETSALGLIPETGIKQLLGSRLPNPAHAGGIPRAEIYLCVENALAFHQRALEAGAYEVSGFEVRDWGDRAAYCLDIDGHVLAFAEKIE